MENVLVFVCLFVFLQKNSNEEMKKRLSTIILWVTALMLVMSAQAQEMNDWENPAVLGINKLPYHATLQLPSKWKE